MAFSRIALVGVGVLGSDRVHAARETDRGAASVGTGRRVTAAIAHAGVTDTQTHTEASLLALVQERYARRHGNGQRWAIAFHVRDRAGFDASRTLDAVAVDTWPSSGLALHGLEVKVSRSDWRRELAHPEKAAAFTRFVDFFWIVAPAGVVAASELPDGWGLLEARGTRLVQAVAARRGSPEPVDRSFLACLMRAACYRTPTMLALGGAPPRT